MGSPPQRYALSTLQQQCTTRSLRSSRCDDISLTHSGVFWIQRSQFNHGECGGLKQAIWWAWLRQDIWAAFRGRRAILSYYTLRKDCAELDRWELVNRVVWLLGQCISFGSDTEVEAGRTNVQQRIHRAAFLSTKLDEWWIYFTPYRSELPVESPEGSAFKPIWINPVPCSKCYDRASNSH
jgi:hypothetical protein